MHVTITSQFLDTIRQPVGLDGGQQSPLEGRPFALALELLLMQELLGERGAQIDTGADADAKELYAALGDAKGGAVREALGRIVEVALRLQGNDEQEAAEALLRQGAFALQSSAS